MFRQTLLPVMIGAALAAGFVLFALAAWILGNGEFVRGDLFKFCLIMLPFSLVFYAFARIVRAIVLAGVRDEHDRRRRDAARRPR